MQEESLIQKRSFAFALEIIKLYMQLRNQKEFTLSKQLLNSGASIGANVEEAGAAPSKKDFISKMSIASKEATEVRCWLRLYKESRLVDINVDTYLDEAEHLKIS